MVGGKRGAFLLEAVLALGVLSTTAWGALQMLSSEGRSARLRADRAVALCAARNLLEEAKALGVPPEGSHPRASWAAGNGLRDGRARLLVDHAAPGGPGLARLRAEVLWTGPDRKPRSLALEALVEDRP